MQDEKIFKIAIITTVIGLIGVIILTGYVNPEQLTIKQIDKTKIDKQVQITATVTDVIQTKTGTQILTLEDDTSSINLVIFPSINVDSNNINQYKNKQVTVIGQVTEYKGQVELILEEYYNLKVK